MNGPALAVREWLDAVPTADAPRPTSAFVFPSWDAWANAGKRIDGLEDALLELLGDPDSVRRAEAATALGFVGTGAAVAPLVDVLQSDVPHVAAEAANALGRLGRAEAVRPLCEAMDSPDVNVRASAATALGNFATEAARERLKRAASDQSSFVRTAAEEALRRAP